MGVTVPMGGGVSPVGFGAVKAVVETPGDVGVGGPAVVVAVDGVSVRVVGGVPEIGVSAVTAVV